MKNLLYSTFTGSKATRYGITNEDTAIEEYVTRQREKGHHNLAVRKSGLVSSADNPWLAASPDGVVKDPSYCVQSPAGLVEIKNPYSAKNLTIAERTLKKCCKSMLIKKGDTIVLNQKHDYYYQIQTQMNCANADWCDFVVRTEADMHIERIERDKEWWEKQLPRLRRFCFEALLPELASPRNGVGGIREPSEMF